MDRRMVGACGVLVCVLSGNLLAQEAPRPVPVPRITPIIDKSVVPASATLADPQQPPGLVSLEIRVIERRRELIPADDAQPQRNASGEAITPQKLKGAGGPVGDILSAEDTAELVKACQNDPECRIVAAPRLLLQFGAKGTFQSGAEYLELAEIVEDGELPLLPFGSVITPAEIAQENAAATPVLEPQFFGTKAEATVTQFKPDLLRVAVMVEHSEMAPHGGRTVRRVQTQTELQPGQTLQLSGLKSRMKGICITTLQFWGEIPFLGEWLFSKTSEMDFETELIVLVTPYLVDDMK